MANSFIVVARTPTGRLKPYKGILKYNNQYLSAIKGVHILQMAAFILYFTYIYNIYSAKYIIRRYSI